MGACHHFHEGSHPWEADAADKSRFEPDRLTLAVPNSWLLVLLNEFRSLDLRIEDLGQYIE